MPATADKLCSGWVFKQTRGAKMVRCADPCRPLLYYRRDHVGLVIVGTAPRTVLNSFCLSGDAWREALSAPIMIVSVNRMGSIFLSYRREDSEGQAGRLYDDLVAVFGSDSVFMDVAAIQPGRDFRKSIDQSLNSCGVFLSLIGKSWLTAKDASVQRRLDDPADFVRIETGAALKRDIPVIPVLVLGASAPKPDQLPDDLKELAFRNAVELTHARWDSDIQVLIKALRPQISQPGTKPEPEPVQPGSKLRVTKSLAVIAVLLVIVIGLAFYLRPAKKVVDRPASPPVETTATAAAADSPPARAHKARYRRSSVATCKNKCSAHRSGRLFTGRPTGTSRRQSQPLYIHIVA